MENIRERRLRLWKARQEAEGYDVSKVKTLEEAEHFFDKKELPAQTNPPGPAGHPPLDKGGNDAPQGEGLEAPEIPDEEETTDEQCDIDPVDEPV